MSLTANPALEESRVGLGAGLPWGGVCAEPASHTPWLQRQRARRSGIAPTPERKCRMTVVAAGWLAATAAGAVAGAAVGGAAGGIVGALTDEGVPENDAHVYAEGVRRGGTLVTARVEDLKATEAQSILQRHKSVDVTARSAAYRQSGWTRFDAAAPAFTSDEVIKERSRYSGL